VSLPKKDVALRLAAEFMVIVVGVWVALGVDSWASQRNDRVLERDYLERLLDDVRYDIREYAFVDSVARLNEVASRHLSSPDVVSGLSPSLLIANLMAAADERVADPSRATYEELVNSGQVELILSPEVRRGLSTYARRLTETAEVWRANSPELRRWASSRIPSTVIRRYAAACQVQTSDGVNVVSTVCEFDPGAWSTESLRAEILSPAGQQRMRLAENTYVSLSGFAKVLSGSARELEALLVAELSRSEGGAL
jgi:hypothetical protein